MATTEEVKKLAALARIRIDDTEIEKFTSEFDAILAYVGQVEELKLPSTGSESAFGGKPALRNVMRADGEPHAAGKYTETLAKQFSQRDGNALKVKQIIIHEEAE